MIITTTVYITADGGIRLATRSDSKPRKGELAATLVLEVPDSAFNPPALTLRATVAGAKPEPVTKPVTQPTVVNGNGAPPPMKDVWTSERLRRVMALVDLDAETLTRRIGVSTATVRAWERAPRPFEPSEPAREKLAALETQAHGVTA